MSDPSPTLPITETDVAADPREELERTWSVILHNDELHTYDYVMELCIRLFGKDLETAYRHAIEVDTAGTTVLATLPKPQAIDRRNAILRYGGDPRMNTSISMNASIEPSLN